MFKFFSDLTREVLRNNDWSKKGLPVYNVAQNKFVGVIPSFPCSVPTIQSFPLLKSATHSKFVADTNGGLKEFKVKPTRDQIDAVSLYFTELLTNHKIRIGDQFVEEFNHF